MRPDDFALAMFFISKSGSNGSTSGVADMVQFLQLKVTLGNTMSSKMITTKLVSVSKMNLNEGDLILLLYAAARKI